MLHGFAYADAPGAAWPGFAAFSPYNGAVGYGEAWGPRQPMWQHVTDVSGHLRRTQFALQSGVNRADLAWFRQKGWTATGIGVGWGTNVAIGLGWSYGFISAPLLSLDSAQVRDGRLAPDGPAYRAVIVEGDRFRGNATTLQLDGARELDRRPSGPARRLRRGLEQRRATAGLPQPGEDAEVRGLVADMLGLRNVRAVAVADDLPGRSPRSGWPGSSSTRPSTLMHVHRFVPESLGAPATRGGVDVLPRERPARREPQDHPDRAGRLADAERPGSVPYRLHTWTGEVEPIATTSPAGGGSRSGWR